MLVVRDGEKKRATGELSWTCNFLYKCMGNITHTDSEISLFINLQVFHGTYEQDFLNYMDLLVIEAEKKVF